MKLNANEAILTGTWFHEGSANRADAVCERIDWLTKHALERVATSAQWGDWEILYRDPADGRYWELTYPRGDLQGGGPPQLQVLSPAAAAGKYPINPMKGSSGMRGAIVISDPWEFASMTGQEQVTGTVEALTETTATLRLDSVLRIQGNAMTIAEVTTRHTGSVFKIPCPTTPANITFRAEDHPGWYAAIGTLPLG